MLLTSVSRSEEEGEELVGEEGMSSSSTSISGTSEKDSEREGVKERWKGGDSGEDRRGVVLTYNMSLKSQPSDQNPVYFEKRTEFLSRSVVIWFILDKTRSGGLAYGILCGYGYWWVIIFFFFFLNSEHNI